MVSGTDTGVDAEVVGVVAVVSAGVVVEVVGGAEVEDVDSVVFSADVVGVADVVGAGVEVVSVSAPLPPELVAALPLPLPLPDAKAPVLSACRIKTPRSIQPAWTMAKMIANTDNNFNDREYIVEGNRSLSPVIENERFC